MLNTSTTTSDSPLKRSPDLLDRQRSRLMIIDMQQKLLPVIDRSADVMESVLFLQESAAILGVPMLVSEQYPQGLGATVPEILERAGKSGAISKLRFSAAQELESFFTETALQIVLVGIETHVCVLQTALDLLSLGLNVFVVEDAVGSRHLRDHRTALKRLRDAGAVVCSAEGVVFEWCGIAGTDEFRQISKLVRARDLRRKAAPGGST